MLAGQSNMSGLGRDPLSTAIADGLSEVWNYTNAGKWEIAREPLDDARGQVDAVSADPFAGIGPGTSFAVHMRRLRPGMKVGLIPCAKGGSAIAEWAPRLDRATLFGSCVARAREAGASGRIAGILWYQGEADATAAELAKGWDRAFGTVAAAFRKELGDVPIVYVQIGNLSEARRAAFPYWDEVKAVQARVALPKSAMIKADAHELSADGIHLTTKGSASIGAEMARAMDALLPREPEKPE